MSGCSECSLSFKHGFTPEDFLWGKKNSPILVVALNPKTRPWYEKYTKADLEVFFDDDKNKSLPFFKNYRTISPKLFDMLGRDKGAAHTDIVKCYSPKFPKKAIANCRPYFEKQLKKLLPKLIICNGISVCQVVTDIVKPPLECEVSYQAKYDGAKIIVVLSGFIGRIDHYAKRRLGLEIERYMEELNIS